MIQLINHAVSALNAGGIPAVRVYPNVWQTALTESVAAVGIGKLEARSKQVQIQILTPSCLGGAACEDAAIKAYELVQALGQVSITAPCKYDGKSDLFIVELTLGVGSME